MFLWPGHNILIFFLGFLGENSAGTNGDLGHDLPSGSDPHFVHLSGMCSFQWNSKTIVCIEMGNSNCPPLGPISSRGGHCDHSGSGLTIIRLICVLGSKHVQWIQRYCCFRIPLHGHTKPWFNPERRLASIHLDRGISMRYYLRLLVE